MHIVEPGDGAGQLANGTIGEAQLFVDVDSAGTNQLLFTFRNIGPAPSIITDVYFDDGTLLAIAMLIDADENGGDAGVDFSEGPSPGNLPGGNLVGFETTAGFLVDADPPPGTNGNGIDPFEELGILFDLQSGLDYDDVIADLESGALRIGIHVQGFADGGSEAFVNNGEVPSTPAPGAVLLAGMGMGLVGWLRRRRAL